MNTTLSRRNALLLTAAAAALPLVGVICRADAQEVPLAIKGYDPVAYFTDGKPVRGRRSSNSNGMTVGGGSPAPSTATFSRRRRCGTRPSSAIIARWRSRSTRSWSPILRTG